MQKLIGCILIIFAGAGMGWMKGMELKKHLSEVEKVRQMFLMLRSEIKHIKSPLPEAFRHIGKRMGGVYEMAYGFVRGNGTKIRSDFYGIVVEIH